MALSTPKTPGRPLARVVKPASTAKITTANRIEASFLRVEIDSRVMANSITGATVHLRAVKPAGQPVILTQQQPLTAQLPPASQVFLGHPARFVPVTDAAAWAIERFLGRRGEPIGCWRGSARNALLADNRAKKRRCS